MKLSHPECGLKGFKRLLISSKIHLSFQEAHS